MKSGTKGVYRRKGGLEQPLLLCHLPLPPLPSRLPSPSILVFLEE